MPFFQTKLTVNQPGDAYEQEADRVADQVMRMPDPSPSKTTSESVEAGVQRQSIQPTPLLCRVATPPVLNRSITNSLVQTKCADCAQKEQAQKEEERPEQGTSQVMRSSKIHDINGSGIVPIQRACKACAEAEEVKRKEKQPDIPGNQAITVQRACADCGEEDTLQRSESTADAGGQTAPSIVSDVLNSGGGQPMDAGTRGFMESRFGQDFGQVRIHTGGKAAESATAINARAYTSGNNVVFGSGEYQPESEGGRRLLAHELVHVGQQGGQINRKNTYLTYPIGKVQRTKLPFWVPLLDGKMLTGTEVHNHVLSNIEDRNRDIRTEVPVPNANRDEVGLGKNGSADLYQSDTKAPVGVYFTGTSGNEVPKKLGGSGKYAKPDFNTRKNIISDIDKGPNSIAIGELKPANEDHIRAGHAQLHNYLAGFEMSNRLTNAWAINNSVGKSWNLKTKEPLKESQVKKYKAHEEELGLADIVETNNQIGYKLKLIYNPKRFLKKRIKGKFHVVPVKGDYGLWVYYATPDNLINALGMPPINQWGQMVRGHMEVATSVNNDLIGKLLTAPEKIIHKSSNKAKKQNKSSKKLIQRANCKTEKKKEERLNDRFDLNQWTKNQKLLYLAE